MKYQSLKRGNQFAVVVLLTASALAAASSAHAKSFADELKEQLLKKTEEALNKKKKSENKSAPESVGTSQSDTPNSGNMKTESRGLLQTLNGAYRDTLDANGKSLNRQHQPGDFSVSRAHSAGKTLVTRTYTEFSLEGINAADFVSAQVTFRPHRSKCSYRMPMQLSVRTYQGKGAIPEVTSIDSGTVVGKATYDCTKLPNGDMTSSEPIVVDATTAINDMLKKSASHIGFALFLDSPQPTKQEAGTILFWTATANHRDKASGLTIVVRAKETPTTAASTATTTSPTATNATKTPVSTVTTQQVAASNVSTTPTTTTTIVGAEKRSREADIIGLRTGMAADEAIKLVRTRHGSAAIVLKETKSEGLPPTEYVHVAESNKIEPRKVEYLTLQFSGPPATPAVLGIERREMYIDAESRPTRDNLRNALIEKYGPPDSERGDFYTWILGSNTNKPILELAKGCGIHGLSYVSDTSRDYCGRVLTISLALDEKNKALVSSMNAKMVDYPASSSANLNTKKYTEDAIARLRADEARRAQKNAPSL